MINSESNPCEVFPVLNIPLTKVRLKYFGKTLKIFDKLRNKFIALTPEEYVRQQFTLWMINHLGYPQSLMANEVGVVLNGMTKRSDTIVYDSDGSILMIVEFKAPYIKLTQDVFDQIVRYNLVLKSKFLIVSNGISHYCCMPNYITGKYQFLDRCPSYMEAKNILQN